MGALSSLATLGLNLAMSEAARQNERDELRSQRKREVRQILAADAEEQRRAQVALQRRLAQERARAGATGISALGGSIDAVLRGLTEESNAARSARDRETAARLDRVRDKYAQREQRNLLEARKDWLALGTRTLGGIRSSGRNLLD